MNPLSDNTLYYTLSTIAQAGAAAFAFLGAFVLFRLQAADARIHGLAVTLAGFTTQGRAFESLQHLIAGHRYKEAIHKMSVSQGVSADIQTNYDSLRSEVASSEKLRLSFRSLITPTIALLACSVAALALVDQIKGSLAIGVLLVFVCWFVYTLVRMAVVLRNCLGE